MALEAMREGEIYPGITESVDGHGRKIAIVDVSRANAAHLMAVMDGHLMVQSDAIWLTAPHGHISEPIYDLGEVIRTGEGAEYRCVDSSRLRYGDRSAKPEVSELRRQPSYLDHDPTKRHGRRRRGR